MHVPDPLTGRRSVRCGGRGRLHGRGGVEPGDVPLVRIARVHIHPIHLWFGRSRLLDGRCLAAPVRCGSRAAAVDEPECRRDGRTAADRLEPLAGEQDDGTTVEQPLGSERHAFGDQRCKAVKKLCEAPAGRLVDGDREVRPLAENPADEAGQDAARARPRRRPARRRRTSPRPRARTRPGGQVLAEDLARSPPDRRDTAAAVVFE